MTGVRAAHAHEVQGTVVSGSTGPHQIRLHREQVRLIRGLSRMGPISQ